jgi:hypothetical protein
MTRIGRPRGALSEISTRALALASERPVSYRDLHLELGLSRRDASLTLSNLLRAQAVVVIDRQMVPGARKPVPVVTAAPPPSVAGKLAALMSWPPCGAVAVGGA